VSTFDQWEAAVIEVVKILKARFPNLTTEETLRLAHEVVKATIAAHG
jgi:hypothetical protein